MNEGSPTALIAASDGHVQGINGTAVNGRDASLVGGAGAVAVVGGPSVVDAGVFQASNGAGVQPGSAQQVCASEVGEELPASGGGSAEAAVPPTASVEDGAWVDVPSPTHAKKRKNGPFGGLFKSRKGKTEVNPRQGS